MRRERFIAKLRELGYSFRRDAWRVQLWRKGTHEVSVRKRDHIDDDWVRQTLRQCGCSHDDIERFIAQCRI